MDSSPPPSLLSPSNQNQNRNTKAMWATRVMSKRRTWILLCVVIYTVMIYSSWNLLHSILSWYNSTEKGGWTALYASMMLGAVFGLMSMVVAAAVALPSMLVTWITVVVLLAVSGRPRRDLVVEAKKLTAEICLSVFRILVKEGNLVAAAIAVLGYLLLVRRETQIAEFNAD